MSRAAHSPDFRRPRLPRAQRRGMRLASTDPRATRCPARRTGPLPYLRRSCAESEPTCTVHHVDKVASSATAPSCETALTLSMWSARSRSRWTRLRTSSATCWWTGTSGRRRQPDSNRRAVALTTATRLPHTLDACRRHIVFRQDAWTSHRSISIPVVPSVFG